MVAVSEVEVPVDHQHFVLLQILQRLLADLVSTAHMLSRASGLTNSARPPTNVAATPPRSSQPSNGVFFERERSRPRLDAHLQVGRKDGDVRRGTFRQTAARHPQDPRRIHRQQLDEASQRNQPAMHQPIERQRHRRLEADDPERRTVELHLLLVVVMRRVVGGDDVDRAVGDAGEHRVAIRRLAQRRVHLGVGVVRDRRRPATRR